tara:strand:+ start:331 stop:705 length:375 start_codon:yes stop_codon:yes gene_type:complete
MKFTEEDFEYIYNEYIRATNCDLCNNKFKSSRDRHLDHNHETGEIRNIVCNMCNLKKADRKIRSDNTSGYRNIFKQKDKTCKQGFYWEFKLQIDGKRKIIKSSVDIDKLIAFSDKWLLEHPYYT